MMCGYNLRLVTEVTLLAWLCTGVVEPGDRILSAALKNNEEGLRKRRIALEISPEVEVQIPSKYRVLGAKVNLSQHL